MGLRIPAPGAVVGDPGRDSVGLLSQVVDLLAGLKVENGRKKVKSAPHRPILSANRTRQRPTAVHAHADPAQHGQNGENRPDEFRTPAFSRFFSAAAAAPAVTVALDAGFLDFVDLPPAAAAPAVLPLVAPVGCFRVIFFRRLGGLSNFFGRFALRQRATGTGQRATGEAGGQRESITVSWPRHGGCSWSIPGWGGLALCCAVDGCVQGLRRCDSRPVAVSEKREKRREKNKNKKKGVETTYFAFFTMGWPLASRSVT